MVVDGGETRIDDHLIILDFSTVQYVRHHYRTEYTLQLQLQLQL